MLRRLKFTFSIRGKVCILPYGMRKRLEQLTGNWRGGRQRLTPVKSCQRAEEAKSATVGKTATVKMQSESKENWVPTRFHMGPFMGPSFWHVLKNMLLSIPERS